MCFWREPGGSTKLNQKYMWEYIWSLFKFKFYFVWVTSKSKYSLMRKCQLMGFQSSFLFLFSFLYSFSVCYSFHKVGKVMPHHWRGLNINWNRGDCCSHSLLQDHFLALFFSLYFGLKPLWCILAKIRRAFSKVSEREIKEGVLAFSFTEHQRINHLYSIMRGHMILNEFSSGWFVFWCSVHHTVHDLRLWSLFICKTTLESEDLKTENLCRKK